MDLVVAVYNEDIDWIHEITVNRIFLYLKNSLRYIEIQTKFPTARIEILENIGRESHTYLHHICQHYDKLGEYTVFLQGNPFDHCEKGKLLRLLHNNKNPILFFGNFYSCDEIGQPDHPGLPVGKMYEECFGENRKVFNFIAGAQFFLAKEILHKNSLEKYKFLLNKHYNEPEFPWCMERYWIYLFA